MAALVVYCCCCCCGCFNYLCYACINSYKPRFIFLTLVSFPSGADLRTQWAAVAAGVVLFFTYVCLFWGGCLRFVGFFFSSLYTYIHYFLYPLVLRCTLSRDQAQTSRSLLFSHTPLHSINFCHPEWAHFKGVNSTPPFGWVCPRIGPTSHCRSLLIQPIRKLTQTVVNKYTY